MLDEAILKLLGFVYGPPHRKHRLTDEPSISLNVPAFIEGKDQCWDALKVTTEVEKKTNKKIIILSSWLFYNNEQQRGWMPNLFYMLLVDGFDIYIPTGDRLDKLSLNLAYNQLENFTPVNTRTARNLANQAGLMSDKIEIINTRRLDEIFDIIPYGLTTELSNTVPTFKRDRKLTSKNAYMLSLALDPDDRLEVEANWEMSTYPVELLSHIDHLIVQQGGLTWDNTLLGQIHKLTFYSNEHSVSELIEDTVLLNSLDLVGCELPLNTITNLSGLAKLTLSHLTTTSQHIHRILEQTPSLNTLELNNVTVDEALSNESLPSLQLQQLNHLSISYTTHPQTSLI